MNRRNAMLAAASAFALSRSTLEAKRAAEHSSRPPLPRRIRSILRASGWPAFA